MCLFYFVLINVFLAIMDHSFQVQREMLSKKSKIRTVFTDAGDRADPLSRRAIRTSAGWVFGIPWQLVDGGAEVIMRTAHARGALVATTPRADARPLRGFEPLVVRPRELELQAVERRPCGGDLHGAVQPEAEQHDALVGHAEPQRDHRLGAVVEQRERDEPPRALRPRGCGAGAQFCQSACSTSACL